MTTTSRERTDARPSTAPSSLPPLPVAGTTPSANPDFFELQSPSPESSQADARDFGDYIDEFFRYNPGTLYKAKNHTTSTGTRPPAFFDRHLDPELQLKHIVYLPSITTDLMAIADDALKIARLNETIPPWSDEFPTQDQRKKKNPIAIVDNIIAERQIETIYLETTAKFCSLVAATLEFQLSAWSPGPLRYSVATDKTQSIADGFLNIDKTACNSNIPPPSMSYASVADTFPTLAIWEFKSLTSGTLDVMEAILQQAVGDLAFPWEGCELGKTCSGNAKHAENGFPKVTGNRMGPDAAPPICPSAGNVPSVTFVRTSKVLSNHARTSATRITQQTWTEAVRDDVTFVIIHSGNLEIIGIRNRGKKTLYLSNVIKVDGCSYGKLHTGLYIAALRDAASRTCLLKPPNTIPASWTNLYGKGIGAKMAATEILNQACLRDWLVMQPSSKKESFIGFILNKYHFREKPSKGLIENTPADLQSFSRIILTGRNPLGSHFIARGTLKVDGNRLEGSSNGIIVKVAHTDDAIAKLHREHGAYLTLLDAGVTELPRIIGFFQYVDIEERVESPLSCAILVMQDAGLPVNQVPESLTRQHLTYFQDLLRRIHHAGFIHNSLSRNNLMIRAGGPGPGSVSIVSFGNAQKIGEGRTDAFDDELKWLVTLLPNPSKHTIDGGPTDSFKNTILTPVLNVEEDSDNRPSSSTLTPPRKKYKKASESRRSRRTR